MSEHPETPEDPGLAHDIEALKEKQLRELREFEERQRQELQAFERREVAEIKAFEEEEAKTFEIKIDRTEYKVHQRFLTGVQLRQLPNPPIGPDRDLFEVVPGGSDKKIADDEKVEMRNGLRFFTAPAQINPGSHTR